MKWRKGGFEKFREAWIRQFCADRKLSTAAKTVLTILSLYLNRDTLTAWPSTRTLDKETGLSRNTVLKAIEDAAGREHVAVERGFRKGGHRAVNVYRPLLHGTGNGGSQTEPGWFTSVHQDGSTVCTTVVQSVEPEHLNEPLTEPLNEPVIPLSPQAASSTHYLAKERKPAGDLESAKGADTKTADQQESKSGAANGAKKLKDWEVRARVAALFDDGGTRTIEEIMAAVDAHGVADGLMDKLVKDRVIEPADHGLYRLYSLPV